MEFSIKELIANKNYEGLIQALSRNPDLANAGIAYDDKNPAKASPLHRICDGVFSEKYTDEEAAKMAKIFLEFGANINGDKLIEKQDTPLTAAASLLADQVAILYIENGADINHAGCHGGTALHWAAWCGRHIVVRRLVQEGAEINKLCIDFKATPLFWAVHGAKKWGEDNLHDYLECIRILVQSGADKNIPNADGNTVLNLLNDEDVELKQLLN
jgi:ankyrin repeat protein